MPSPHCGQNTLAYRASDVYSRDRTRLNLLSWHTVVCRHPPDLHTAWMPKFSRRKSAPKDCSHICSSSSISFQSVGVVYQQLHDDDVSDVLQVQRIVVCRHLRHISWHLDY